MSHYPPLLNKRLLVFIKGGFRYQGTAVHEDEVFLHIDDEKTGRLVVLSKSEIATIEIFNGVNP